MLPRTKRHGSSSDHVVPCSGDLWRILHRHSQTTASCLWQKRGCHMGFNHSSHKVRTSGCAMNQKQPRRLHIIGLGTVSSKLDELGAFHPKFFIQNHFHPKTTFIQTLRGPTLRCNTLLGPTPRPPPPGPPGPPTPRTTHTRTDRAGPPLRRTAPPLDRPKFRTFFPSPATIYILFSLSCWSCSLNFGGVFEGRDPQMCTFGLSGCRVKPRRPHHRAAEASHDSRKLQTCTLQGTCASRHHQNSLRRPPETHRNSETVAGEGRKSAKFWAPHPLGPHPFRAPPF